MGYIFVFFCLLGDYLKEVNRRNVEIVLEPRKSLIQLHAPF